MDQSRSVYQNISRSPMIPTLEKLSLKSSTLGYPYHAFYLEKKQIIIDNNTRWIGRPDLKICNSSVKIIVQFFFGGGVNK